MSRRRTTIAAIIVALGAATLSGCTFPGTGSASPSPSAPAAPAASASASPSTAPPSVALPATCRELVSPEVYTATFGDTPLNDPAFGEQGESGVVTPAPAGEGAGAEEQLRAAVRLDCVWGSPTADITGLTATVAVVDPAVASAFLDTLPAAGYGCTDLHGGRRCQQITTDPTYQVPVGSTRFLRDDIYIDVRQANFPTNDLLGSITQRIWG
jgi:hypothetical protein